MTARAYIPYPERLAAAAGLPAAAVAARLLATRTRLDAEHCSNALFQLSPHRSATPDGGSSVSGKSRTRC